MCVKLAHGKNTYTYTHIYTNTHTHIQGRLLSVVNRLAAKHKTTSPTASHILLTLAALVLISTLRSRGSDATHPAWRSASIRNVSRSVNLRESLKSLPWYCASVSSASAFQFHEGGFSRGGGASAAAAPLIGLKVHCVIVLRFIKGGSNTLTLHYRPLLTLLWT